MFKALKDNKIIAISDTDNEFFCLVCDAIANEPEHTTADFIQINGEYLLKSENTAYLNEQAKQNRASAYSQEVDNLMSEYTRKEKFNLFEEGEAEALRQEIQTKVDEIKARYPYIEE